MAIPKVKLTRNKLFILLGILGLIVTYSIVPDDEIIFEVSTPPPVVDDKSLPLPPIGPREQGFNPLNQPFMFELGGTDKMTGLKREQIIDEKYHEILVSLSDTAPAVEVEQISGLTVVTIGGEPLLTVLPSDAPEYYNRLNDEQKKQLEQQIANHWKQLLEADLAVEVFWRSPKYLKLYPYFVSAFFFVSLILFALADVFAKRVLRSPGWSLKGFVIFGFMSLAAGMHPTLKPMAIALAKGGLAPVFFFLIVATVCELLYRLGCRIMHNYVQAYLERSKSSDERLKQRTETMTEGGRFLIGSIVFLGGVLWFFGALGVDLGQLFAGAGVMGIAIGVVGKDILVDYFYGINILADDQFSLGDFIETKVARGTVERFNLRCTRIRETDGGLSIVTNGHFGVVKNHSREFAYADFRISVPYGTDTDHCFKLILEEIETYAQEFPEKLQPVPRSTGVHELGESVIVLRALVRTAALAQWAVKRELNRRILQRFEREGVGRPIPQMVVLTRQD
jgi:small-conductance mechanosensitive channel